MIQSAWWARVVVALVHVDWRVLAVLRGTMVLLFAACVAYYLRQSPASDRHRLWALSLGICLLLPVLSAFAAGGAGAVAFGVGSPSLAVPQSVAVVWLVGAAAVLARALLGVVIATRIARAATPLDDDGWRRLLAEARSRMGVSRRVELRATARVAAPITLGWLRPVVLLPPGYVAWSAECRRAVIAHELAHVRRHDWPLQLAERLVCAIYWFNPIVRCAATRRRIEAERACDEMVIAKGIPRSDYARHLVAVAEGSGRPLSGAMGLGRVGGDLDERVRAILGPQPAMRRRRWLGGATGVLAVGGASIVMSSPGPVCPVAMEAARIAAGADSPETPARLASP